MRGADRSAQKNRPAGAGGLGKSALAGLFEFDVAEEGVVLDVLGLFPLHKELRLVVEGDDAAGVEDDLLSCFAEGPPSRRWRWRC